MKTVLSWLFTVLLFVPARLSAEPRVFTSSDGKSITAELVSATKGQATLKLQDGRETVVPVARFGDTDQEFIRDWAKAHPVAIHYDFDMTWTKSRSGISTKTDTSREAKITTEKWICHFKITNRSHQTLEGLDARWQVYYLKSDGKNSTLEHKDGVSKIPSIKHMETIAFDSEPVQLNTFQLTGGYAYADGTPAKYADTFKGVSVNLVSDGQSVFESTTNGIPKPTETGSKPAK